ncbi:MAG: hypothetical protein E7316_03430 [Clostridiales bacterium]|nr:hypothetical protein [Clostridiales bacterium]
MKRIILLAALSLLVLTLAGCAAPEDQTGAADQAAATATRAAIQEYDFDPAQVGTLQSATLTWTHASDRSVIHTAALTDPNKLRTLEGILAGAKQVENVPMCFDGPAKHELTLVRADGSVMTVLVSLDECAYLREGDVCFNYERAATQLTGKDNNTAIYDLFDAAIR